MLLVSGSATLLWIDSNCRDVNRPLLNDGKYLMVAVNVLVGLASELAARTERLLSRFSLNERLGTQESCVVNVPPP